MQIPKLPSAKPPPAFFARRGLAYLLNCRYLAGWWQQAFLAPQQPPPLQQSLALDDALCAEVMPNDSAAARIKRMYFINSPVLNSYFPPAPG
jgi:hypothetical protein